MGGRLSCPYSGQFTHKVVTNQPQIRCRAGKSSGQRPTFSHSYQQLKSITEACFNVVINFGHVTVINKLAGSYLFIFMPTEMYTLQN